jgi:serine/threonine protein kinase
VAVKVIAPHVAGEAFRERFLAERQILAGLNHPNITKLLDGGVTAEGTPYLVMEYVDGEPLDRYCDAHRLGLRERLELFLKVCAPVAYAHRNLVVHRDLKPSNILVTGDGQPMLLDFGTAKFLVGAENCASVTAAMVTIRYRADTGETAPAIQQVLAAMPVVRRTYPALSINLWTPLAAATHVFNLAGRFTEAEAYAREELAVVDALPSPELDLRRAQTLWEMGLALQGQNKNVEGSAVLERSASIYEKFGPGWVKRGAEVRKLERVPAQPGQNR